MNSTSQYQLVPCRVDEPEHEPYADAFDRYLIERGYARDTVRAYVGYASHFCDGRSETGSIYSGSTKRSSRSFWLTICRIATVGGRRAVINEMPMRCRMLDTEHVFHNRTLCTKRSTFTPLVSSHKLRNSSPTKAGTSTAGEIDCANEGARNNAKLLSR